MPVSSVACLQSIFCSPHSYHKEEQLVTNYLRFSDTCCKILLVVAVLSLLSHPLMKSFTYSSFKRLQTLLNVCSYFFKWNLRVAANINGMHFTPNREQLNCRILMSLWSKPKICPILLSIQKFTIFFCDNYFQKHSFIISAKYNWEI